MKRLSIIRVVMFIAVLSLLSATALPHHHHLGDAAAIVLNSLTGHSDDGCQPSHSDNSHTCLEDEAFDVAKFLSAPQAATLFLPANILPSDVPNLLPPSPTPIYAAPSDIPLTTSPSPRHAPMRGSPTV